MSSTQTAQSFSLRFGHIMSMLYLYYCNKAHGKKNHVARCVHIVAQVFVASMVRVLKNLHLRTFYI